MRRTGFAAIVVLSFSSATLAVDAPDRLNFQGVLRDSAEQPLDGSYDMVFRFFDADSGGNELMVNRHLTVNGEAIVVSAGLFSARLGEGEMLDGSGPGVFTTLAEVFGSHTGVWIAVQVDAEALAPRLPVSSAAWALNAARLGGRPAQEFIDTSSASQSKGGPLTVDGSAIPDSTAITGLGARAGADFQNSSTGTLCEAATSDYGVRAVGALAGGRFRNLQGDGGGFVGLVNVGVRASGSEAGAYFFEEPLMSDAWLGSQQRGIVASGTYMGGRFVDMDGSASANVAFGDTGIEASGAASGGYFSETDASGVALVAHADRGIWGKGTFAGGTFSHPDGTTYWADVAQLQGSTTYKIRGTGQVSFVQNHPYEHDKVVVYAALEGDEVAVYTRGSARLVNGLARVRLGESFALVAHPDLGLTVHLTARSELVPLRAEELSTSEIVVRGPQGSSATFDYLVHGLRIGFEEHAVIQPKEREALLPPPGAARTFYRAHPELQRFNPLERYRVMGIGLGKGDDPDLSSAVALHAAIDAGRDEILAAARASIEFEAPPRAGAIDLPATSPAAIPQTTADAASRSDAPQVLGTPADGPSDRAEVDDDRPWMRVAEPAEAGDLLALDPLQPGLLRRTTTFADPHVIGVADGPARPSESGGFEVPLAGSRYTTLHVDAGYGEIAAGDLLVASPTPGHAMRSAAPLPGTVIGKALEPHASGTGSIRVALMLD